MRGGLIQRDRISSANMEQQDIDNDEAIINRAFNSEVGAYPMTAGHLEIQAVKNAVRETSNAILTVKSIINDLPLSRLSLEQQGYIENNLEDVSGRIQQVPEVLTRLLIVRTEEVARLIRDRTIVKDTMQKNLAAVGLKVEQMRAREEALLRKEKELIVEAEAFQANRNTADAKLKEAVELFRAAEKKEKLLACRERRLVGLEEKQVLTKFLNPSADGAADEKAEADPAIASEDDESWPEWCEKPSADAEVELVADRERRVEKPVEQKAVGEMNLGADAAMEDAAEAAAAERRVMRRPNRPTKNSTTAAEIGETWPTDLERQSSNTTLTSSRDRDLLGPDTIAAKEERLWQRETHLASKEFYVRNREADVRNREAAVLEREKLLKHFKTDQTQLIQIWRTEIEQLNGKWKKQVECEYEKLKVSWDEIMAWNHYLIAFRKNVRGSWDEACDMIEKAKGIVREARALLRADGGAVVLEQETREKRVSDLIAEARGVIGVKYEVRGMQDRVSELIREARGLVGAGDGGGGGGGDEGDGEAEDGILDDGA